MDLKPRAAIRRVFIFCDDVIWVAVAILFTYLLRLNLGMIPNDWFHATVELTVIAVVSHGFTFWIFWRYCDIWRSASIPVLFRLFNSRNSDQSLAFEFCLGKVG